VSYVRQYAMVEHLGNGDQHETSRIPGTQKEKDRTCAAIQSVSPATESKLLTGVAAALLSDPPPRICIISQVAARLPLHSSRLHTHTNVSSISARGGVECRV
jgi:hypothetical protein